MFPSRGKNEVKFCPKSYDLRGPQSPRSVRVWVCVMCVCVHARACVCFPRYNLQAYAVRTRNLKGKGRKHLSRTSYPRTSLLRDPLAVINRNGEGKSVRDSKNVGRERLVQFPADIHEVLATVHRGPDVTRQIRLSEPALADTVARPVPEQLRDLAGGDERLLLPPQPGHRLSLPDQLLLLVQLFAKIGTRGVRWEARGLLLPPLV